MNGEANNTKSEVKVYKTSFNHGLKLKCPKGWVRYLGSCTWSDDPLYIIEGRVMKKYDNKQDLVPVRTEVLAPGTRVYLWDDDEDMVTNLLGEIE